jgi:predicted transcriptional regulator
MPGEEAMTGKEDFAASLMDDMDPRLLELIQKRVNSFIKWDLVRFFHDNPHTTDTADSIARYTGRDVRTVDPELLQLAQDGVLEMEDLSGMRVYTLTHDPEVRDLIARFIQACDDRQFRVKAIYHVIRSLR